MDEEIRRVDEEIRQVDEQIAILNGSIMVVKAKAYDAEKEIAAFGEQKYRMEEYRKIVVEKLAEQKEKTKE